jgi:hypothetical protein
MHKYEHSARYLNIYFQGKPGNYSHALNRAVDISSIEWKENNKRDKTEIPTHKIPLDHARKKTTQP